MCEREREREREKESVCVCVREREKEKERECVCVCVCVRERESSKRAYRAIFVFVSLPVLLSNLSFASGEQRCVRLDPRVEQQQILERERNHARTHPLCGH